MHYCNENLRGRCFIVIKIVLQLNKIFVIKYA